MDEIIKYLQDTYHPSGILIYGSFANCTNGEYSDFDALLIADTDREIHDHSIINSTQLDVFLYPIERLQNIDSIQDFIRIYGGRILADETGVLQNLLNKVTGFIEVYPGKTPAEIEKDLAWCDKMLLRAKRADMEGLYRLHWLLVDSLELYFDIKHMFYMGPKKGIRYLQSEDITAAELYNTALTELNYENLQKWISFLKTTAKCQEAV